MWFEEARSALQHATCSELCPQSVSFQSAGAQNCTTTFRTFTAKVCKTRHQYSYSGRGPTVFTVPSSQGWTTAKSPKKKTNLQWRLCLILASERMWKGIVRDKLVFTHCKSLRNLYLCVYNCLYVFPAKTRCLALRYSLRAAWKEPESCRRCTSVQVRLKRCCFSSKQLWPHKT